MCFGPQGYHMEKETKIMSTEQNIKISAPTCEAFLSAVREAARKRKGWTDRGCEVLESGADYYVVKTYEGTIAWEGKSHCGFCARAEAITHKSGTRHEDGSSGEIA